MLARFALGASITAALSALLLAGCSEGPAAPSNEDAQAVPEVNVVELQPAPASVICELPGRISPIRIAQVRARVSGIVVSRNFMQGSDVNAGAALDELARRTFEIDLSS